MLFRRAASTSERAALAGQLHAAAGLVALLRVAVTIALVGDHNDAYPSHRELDAARVMLGPDVVTEWMATDGDRVGDLSGSDGIWLPSPHRVHLVGPVDHELAGGHVGF
jgi:hypothetical protein